jgi:hypothetical protein
MTDFPGSPQLVKAGLVLVDSTTGRVLRTIALQYNPDTLTRSLSPQGAGGEGQGGRGEALRLKAPAVETIRLEAELDAADRLEQPQSHPGTAQNGLAPELALLERLVNPAAAQLRQNNALLDQGKLEIIPMEQPLTLFVWSRNRVVPVRVTELSVTEEAFDPRLNPIRAKVSLSLRVLSVDDLGFAHRGGGVFMAHLDARERLAGVVPSVEQSALGLTGGGF